MNLAVVIGVNNYVSSNYSNLPACYNDARTVSDVLKDVKKFEEVLFLNSDESAHQIKTKMSDFIEKYKNSSIDEFIFYFSGHGERIDNDFFYLPHDFTKDKKEATGLRNSELDGWIKSVSPKLCVKIVDACFSGTQYIKSESNTEAELRKSAKKFGINDLYFWFSSREDEASYAGSEFSGFTESILTAITEHEGDIRYRDIMAYVADDFSNKGSSKPVFITQADNIEKFGEVTKETHRIIFEAFGIEGHSHELPKEKVEENTKSIYEQIKLVSAEQCFSEEKLLEFIAQFNQDIENWGVDLSGIFEMKATHGISSYNVPNSRKIGNWLVDNQETNFFALPLYAESEYEEEEYKALPKKPKKASGYLSSIERIRAFGFGLEEDDTEYRLETVTKTRRYIDGFKYTHSLDEAITSITFESQVGVIKPFSLYIVPIYSNNKLVLHYSYEELHPSSWDNFSSPKCETWRLYEVKVNLADSVNIACEHIKSEVVEWIEGKLKKIAGQA